MIPDLKPELSSRNRSRHQRQHHRIRQSVGRAARHRARQLTHREQIQRAAHIRHLQPARTRRHTRTPRTRIAHKTRAAADALPERHRTHQQRPHRLTNPSRLRFRLLRRIPYRQIRIRRVKRNRRLLQNRLHLPGPQLRASAPITLRPRNAITLRPGNVILAGRPRGHHTRHHLGPRTAPRPAPAAPGLITRPHPNPHRRTRIQTLKRQRRLIARRIRVPANPRLISRPPRQEPQIPSRPTHPIIRRHRHRNNPRNRQHPRRVAAQPHLSHRALPGRTRRRHRHHREHQRHNHQTHRPPTPTNHTPTTPTKNTNHTRNNQYQE